MKIRKLRFGLFFSLIKRSFSVDNEKSYDVLIAGGGLMGLSVAYFLARRIAPSSVCVVERDLQVFHIIFVHDHFLMSFF